MKSTEYWDIESIRTQSIAERVNALIKNRSMVSRDRGKDVQFLSGESSYDRVYYTIDVQKHILEHDLITINIQHKPSLVYPDLTPPESSTSKMCIGKWDVAYTMINCLDSNDISKELEFWIFFPTKTFDIILPFEFYKSNEEEFDANDRQEKMLCENYKRAIQEFDDATQFMFPSELRNIIFSLLGEPTASLSALTPP